jgi:hypothetical protein
MRDTSRSIFYGLPLVGVGTPQVESLRSYLLRLAAEHSMIPREVVATVTSLQPHHRPDENLKTIWSGFPVSGTSDRAVRLATMLSEATGVDLAPASLVRFRHVISAHRLCHSRKTRYCPECVRQRVGDAHVHAPLLWELKIVNACPVHGVRLLPTAECGVPPSARLPINRRVSLPGVCGRCGSIGFRCVGASDLAGERDIWVATQAGKLLALSATESRSLTREMLTAGIREMVDVRFDGKPVQAATQARLARSTVLHWLKGAEGVELAALLELAYLADADVTELFRGRYTEVGVAIDAQRGGDTARILPPRYERHDWTSVQVALSDAANDENMPSLLSVLAPFGIDNSEARRRYPTECRTVASRHDAARRKQWRQVYDASYVAFSKAAAELRYRGVEPTWSRVQEAANLACFGATRNTYRSRALEDVLAGRTGRTVFGVREPKP